jgi:D-sedoheptulose 7-phosphate isomerase
VTAGKAGVEKMDGARRYVGEIEETLERLPWEDIERAVGVLYQARLSDRQVFIMGNGGSAATASHFACDLAKGTLLPGRPRFRVIALTDSMPLFSALANDYGYDRVFIEQLASLVRQGDVVIGISGSGRSPNVVNALHFAREMGATTIGMTGFDGGEVKPLVDVSVHVENRCMEQVEDVHLLLEHLVCTELRSRIGADACPADGRTLAVEEALRATQRERA